MNLTKTNAGTKSIEFLEAALHPDDGDLRRVEAVSLVGLDPAAEVGEPPGITMVKIDRLLIDPAYQRDVSHRSIKLIRKIVEGWSWARFKPPVVTPVNFFYHVIDGQHTAIAAATHPAIDRLPCLVVQAGDQVERAKAFVAHNRDRLNMTPMQVFHAECAAGDPVSVAARDGVEFVGGRILRHPVALNLMKPGDTVAVASLRRLAAAKGKAGVRRVFSILLEAGQVMIASHMIDAVSKLLYAREYAGQMTDAEITAIIARGRWRSQIEDVAREKKIPRGAALAQIVYGAKGSV